MGPEVKELEAALCDFVGAKHCISVSNGTDALIAAYMALGVGPGDAVITTPFTFFATVEAIMMVGATPVFADIDPATFNICPNEIEAVVKRERAKKKLNLRGICPVDLFGLCADYDSINTIAKEHGLFVLQDAAQAFGATQNDRRAPTHGTIGTASFFPAKPLGCYGDGGAVVTDDDDLAERLRSIRVHGKGRDKYDNIRIGQNCRLDTIQAAILKEKLRIYPEEILARQNLARHYTLQFEHLNESIKSPEAICPIVPEGYESVWAQYTVRFKNRNKISKKLASLSIPSVVYYRTPCHLLGACQQLGYQPGDFPNAEKAADEVLSLPFHPYLSNGSIEEIARAIQDQ